MPSIEQIKAALSLEALLACLGHDSKPSRTRPYDYWYTSPLRPDERTPSFHIDTRHDIWYDFGEGEGGDLIAFARYYTQQVLGGDGSLKAAMQWLGQHMAPGFVPPPTKKAVPAQRHWQHQPRPPAPYTLLGRGPVNRPALWRYLTGRGIAPQVISTYLQQVTYQRPGGKAQYGYALPNRAGGYEVGNPLGHKTVLGPKAMTYIQGVDKGALAVFEGTTDCLTFLTRAGHSPAPVADCLVLHSVALQRRAVQFVVAQQYPTVQLWLDNDRAGLKATAAIQQQLQQLLPTATVTPMNHTYHGYADLNDWHRQINY